MTEYDITKEMLQEKGYKTGKYYSKSIYVLRDGTLVDGDFQEGQGRSEDHRMMEEFSEFDRYDDEFWDDIMLTKGLLMIIPEHREVLIHPECKPTTEQAEALIKMSQLGFTISKFE